jgi:hypothetical protein
MITRSQLLESITSGTLIPAYCIGANLVLGSTEIVTILPVANCDSNSVLALAIASASVKYDRTRSYRNDK